MIYLLDADMNGLDSIQERIQSGQVVRLPCPTIKAFDQHCIDLFGKVGPDDLIILDTITTMLDTTRGDFKLGDENADLLTRAAEKYLGGDKNYLTVFEAAAQVVMRRLKNLRARDCRILVTAHEDEIKDDTEFPPLKKVGPQVNPAMVSTLTRACSDMFRLYPVLQPIVGTSGEVIVPAGTRLLRLRRTLTEMAKFHVAPERAALVPEQLRDPTLPKLYQHLGKRPSFLVVYGPPGVGKTTFGTSEVTIGQPAAPAN